MKAAKKMPSRTNRRIKINSLPEFKRYIDFTKDVYVKQAGGRGTKRK